MKHLITVVIFNTFASIAVSQPMMTLWVSPDGYHDHHDHSNIVAFPCDSNYYIFYTHQPGILPIANLSSALQ